MENLTYSSSIKRIDSSSQREIEMMREAIRGEFEPGKYVRDMGTGALSGAAGGAIAGGGIGSVPAAAVGAIGGAAWGLGSNAASDIWYQTRSDEDKASWQAGDLQEHLEKMGGLLTGKTQSPEIGAHLNQLGTQYKNYIDVIVQKTNNEEQKKMYEQNMFNPNTEDYQYFRSQYPQKTSSSKFKRVVHAVDTSPAAMVGGTGAMIGTQQILNKMAPPAVVPQVSKIPITSELISQFLTNEASVSPPIKAQIQQYLQSTPQIAKDYANFLKLSDADKLLMTNNLTKPSQVMFSGIDDVASQAGKQLTKPGFWKSVGTGAKGLGVGLAVDWAANWGLDKIDMAMTGGEINMFRRELADVGKIITEINRLTKNQEDVVYAGNMLWTGLKEVDRMLAEVENKKSQEPQESSASLQANTPGQSTANISVPNNTGPIMSSKTSKFIRLG